MTWNRNTSSGHVALLNDVLATLTSRYVASIVVDTAGLSYAAGEILDINNAGSTRTQDMQIEVLTVGGGGDILTARVYSGGAYTVLPTVILAAATVTTGLDHEGNSVGPGDGNALFDLTFVATSDWTELARQGLLAGTQNVAVGGTGYSVSNVLTVAGGVVAVGGSPATCTVATLSGSAVATVTLTTPGDYEVLPPSPAATTVAPAGGTGCTLTLATIDKTGETLVVLQGDAGSATDPLVGIKTYSSETDETGLNTVYNWAMFSMTAWSSSTSFHNQANISPGITAGGLLTASTTGDGCFVPLKDTSGSAIDWRLRHDGRSFELFCVTPGTSTNHVAQCGGGLLEQFGTTTELPFPAFVAGTSDRKRSWYQDVSSIYGGMSVPISRANGPIFAWSPEGAWIEVKVGVITANQDTTPGFVGVISQSPYTTMWPVGDTSIRTGADAIHSTQGNDGFDSSKLVLATGAVQIYRTPDTGGDKTPLYPLTVIQTDTFSGTFRPFGRIPGVFFLSQADTGASTFDRQAAGAVRYTIFQNGTQVGPADFLCVRED